MSKECIHFFGPLCMQLCFVKIISLRHSILDLALLHWIRGVAYLQKNISLHTQYIILQYTDNDNPHNMFPELRMSLCSLP